MLSNYFSQTVVWEQKIGINDYSKPIKGDAVEIKARKETKDRRVINKDGAEVVASLTVYTNEPVQVEDYIDGRCVISVWPMYAPNGDVAGYEVLT